jgi:hypothetical protein
MTATVHHLDDLDVLDVLPRTAFPSDNAEGTPA